MEDAKNKYRLIGYTKNHVIIHPLEICVPVSTHEQVFIFAFCKLKRVFFQTMIDRFKFVQKVGCCIGILQMINEICSQAVNQFVRTHWSSYQTAGS